MTAAAAGGDHDHGVRWWQVLYHRWRRWRGWEWFDTYDGGEWRRRDRR